MRQRRGKNEVMDVVVEVLLENTDRWLHVDGITQRVNARTFDGLPPVSTTAVKNACVYLERVMNGWCESFGSGGYKWKALGTLEDYYYWRRRYANSVLANATQAKSIDPEHRARGIRGTIPKHYKEKQ